MITNWLIERLQDAAGWLPAWNAPVAPETVASAESIGIALGAAGNWVHLPALGFLIGGMVSYAGIMMALWAIGQVKKLNPM